MVIEDNCLYIRMLVTAYVYKYHLHDYTFIVVLYHYNSYIINLYIIYLFVFFFPV